MPTDDVWREGNAYAGAALEAKGEGRRVLCLSSRVSAPVLAAMADADDVDTGIVANSINDDMGAGRMNVYGRIKLVPQPGEPGIAFN